MCNTFYFTVSHCCGLVSQARKIKQMWWKRRREAARKTMLRQRKFTLYMRRSAMTGSRAVGVKTSPTPYVENEVAKSGAGP